MKKISIVIPAYNESKNLGELYQRLSQVFSNLPKYQFEVVLVENGSSDGSWNDIQTISKKDSRFRGVQLSKNFTAPGGITAGLEHATGDAAIIMCADLQDSPEKIPDFIQKWEEGYDMVYQLITERQGIGLTYKILSNIFHWMMSLLTAGEFVRNATVYRLMDRKVYKAFNQLQETNRYFTGLCNWLGFKTIGIEFPREKRFAGESKAKISVVVKLALNGIFSFSYFPLRIVTYFGVFVSLFSFGYLAVILVNAVKHGPATIPGLTTQIFITLLFFGFLFLAMGILGEYVIRIYDEVKQRPKFIVRGETGRSIRALFDAYKRKSKWDPLVCLPVYSKEGILIANLRPITKDFRLTDPNLAELLGKWRVENPTISTGTFEVTTERTLKWLDNHIIGREDRLLFLVQMLDGSLVGHLGYSNFDSEEESAEVDSVLRGVKEGYPGIMSLAMKTLIVWGRETAKFKKIKLSVYSDNEEPIRFYEKNGFKKAYQKPLYRVELPGESKLEIAPEGYDGPIEKYYLYMEYDLNTLTV